MADDRGCAWIQRGFEEFSNGCCDNGGDNLYVNAAGIIERIHRLDVNGDGHVDLVFPNSHGYIERGPTWIYTQSQGAGADWPRRQLENDSGWMSHAADVDGDGYLDLIVVNGENGVTSGLDSYVYWGGAGIHRGAHRAAHRGGLRCGSCGSARLRAAGFDLSLCLGRSPQSGPETAHPDL